MAFVVDDVAIAAGEAAVEATEVAAETAEISGEVAATSAEMAEGVGQTTEILGDGVGEASLSIEEAEAAGEATSSFSEILGDGVGEASLSIEEAEAAGEVTNMTSEVLGDGFGEQSLKITDNKPLELRDFGLDKCTKAAKEIFNPDVIDNWRNFSDAQRKEFACAYADRVADAFELKQFNGLKFEQDVRSARGDFLKGKNDGKGNVILKNNLISSISTPYDIVNTITHEMRHQYQVEAIEGFHNVSKDVIKEWSAARELYTYERPDCFDPQGYFYNALELDARYAGETVVRNLNKDRLIALDL